MQPGHGEAALETLTREDQQPWLLLLPFVRPCLWCWMNPSSGTASGTYTMCVPDLSSSGCGFTCDFTACLSSSCCAKQELFPLRTLGFCHPEIPIPSHITWAAVAVAHPGPSWEVLLVQSLLLLDILSQRDLLEKGNPMSNFLWVYLCVFVSAELQVPFKMSFREQNIPLQSGLLSSLQGVDSYSTSLVEVINLPHPFSVKYGNLILCLLF